MDWHSYWDPYEAIIICQHNLQQCVLAIRDGSELMKLQAQRINDQQSMINELRHQNRRLSTQLAQIQTELTIIRNQSPKL